jgi:hypothetical protein
VKIKNGSPAVLGSRFYFRSFISESGWQSMALALARLSPRKLAECPISG